MILLSSTFGQLYEYSREGSGPIIGVNVVRYTADNIFHNETKITCLMNCKINVYQQYLIDTNLSISLVGSHSLTLFCDVLALPLHQILFILCIL